MINSRKKGFTNVKGFTLVELVIVIAVVAILAAVLIPTFSNLIKKANLSADQQAVRQMNTVLATEGAIKKNDIFTVFDVLDEAGFTAKDYKPLTKGAIFFWDQDLDRMLLVNDEYKVIYPTEYATVTKEDHVWKSLSQEIAIKQPASYISGDSTTVTVENGAELAYVFNDINNKTSNKNLTITINGIVDMLGANLSVPILDPKAGYNIKITGGTIKNATAVDVGMKLSGGDQLDGQYGSGLFGVVKEGNTLTIENIIFEDINIKNTNASGAAILVGAVYSNSSNDGTVNISGVTIKNSSVIGHRSVGSLVGIDQGDVTLSGNISLENVTVMTVGGRSGMLFGQLSSNDNATFNCSGATINLDNCEFKMFECEQNTGKCPICGNTLELSNGMIHSYNKKGDNTIEHGKKPFNNSLLVGQNGLSNAFSQATINGWE